MDHPRRLESVPVHLGLGARAEPLDGFSWDPAFLAAYDERVASDGAEGRLVTMGPLTDDWSSWERHPAGEEVVLCLSGRCRLVQEVDGEAVAIEVGAGEYVVNPPGVWHTADVLEPGSMLFITPGRGTEHRPR